MATLPYSIRDGKSGVKCTTRLKTVLRLAPVLLLALLIPYFTPFGIASDTFKPLTSFYRATSPVNRYEPPFTDSAKGLNRAYGLNEPGVCLPKVCLQLAIKFKENGNETKSLERLYELRRTWPGTIEAARGALLLALFKIESDRSKKGTAGQEGDKSASGAPTPSTKALSPADALNINAVELLKEAVILPDIKEYIALYRVRALSLANETQRALKIVTTRLDNGSGETLSPVLKPLFLYEEALLFRRLKLALAERASLIRLIKLHPSNRLVPYSLLRVSRLSWNLNDPASAYAFATRLRADYPATPEAGKVEEILEWLKYINTPEQSHTAQTTPTNKNRYKRALNLYKAAMYKEALIELDSIMEEVKKNEPDISKNKLYSEAVLLKAITLFRKKSYTKTIKVLKEEHKNLTKEKRPDALYWIAITALRLGHADTLANALKELDKTPKRRERAWALLFSGRLYETLNKEAVADKFFKAVIKEYNSRPAMLATWHLAWKSYVNGKYTESRNLLNRYIKNKEAKQNRRTGFYKTDRDKFIYWRARSAEKLGLLKKATDAFAGLCAPRQDTYYCQMATERLVKPGRQSPRRVESARTEQKKIYTPSKLELYREYRAARELIKLGLKKEASEELNLLARKLSTGTDNQQQIQARIKEISTLFYATGDYYRGLKLYNKYYLFGTNEKKERGGYLKKTVKDNFSAYPMGVVDSVIDVTKGLGPKRRQRGVNIDPLLVAAIMREESTFNPKAVSRSGALGLMQIMPETGDFIAMKLRAPAPERADLLSPVTNVRYGAWYLSYLALRFKGDVTLTIAGYNAGPNAAAKWAKNRKLKNLSIDEFIESIPYTETRRYTKRVLKSYTAYLTEAGLDTATRFSRPLTLNRAATQNLTRRSVEGDKVAVQDTYYDYDSRGDKRRSKKRERF